MSSQQLFLGSGGGEPKTFLNDVFSIDNYTTEGIGGGSLGVTGTITTSLGGPMYDGSNGAYHLLFNTSGEKIESSNTRAFAFGAGDFSIELYAHRTHDNYSYSRMLHFGPYWNNADAVGFFFDDGDYPNKITFGSYKNSSKGTVPSNGRVLVSSSNVGNDTWYHCCVTRKLGVFRLFIDGKLEAINDSIPHETLEDDYQQVLCLANTKDRSVSEPFHGYLQGIRIIKGYVPEDRDTDATTVGSTVLFTPPTQPHPTTGPANNCGAQGFVCGQTSTPSDFSNSKRIINGIDLAKHGGLVWLKSRNATGWHFWMDTERGFDGTSVKLLYSNKSNTEATTNALRCFNSDGFTLQNGDYNSNANQDVIAYTFRKCPGFFDIVAYTGNGSGGHQVAHNLEATPQWMIVKALGGGSNSWAVYAQDSHAAVGSGSNSSHIGFALDTNSQGSNGDYFWHDTPPTNTHFTLGNGSRTNSYGVDYVAYLFAGNGATGSSIFGKDGDQSVMAAGFYNGNDSSDIVKNLGWEPGWLMIKSANDTNQYANWFMIDNMRGMANKQNDGQRYLAANEHWEENNGGIIGAGSGDFVEFTTNGFKVRPGYRTISQGSPQRKYIYMAIRSPQPSIVKAKSDPNLLFAISVGLNKSYSVNQYAPFATDMAIQKNNDSNDGDWRLSVRNLNGSCVLTNEVSHRSSYVYYHFDYGGYGSQKGGGSVDGGFMDYASSGYYGFHWRRNAGSFDYIMYEGNGVSGKTENHQLGSAPEMMWIKNLQGGTGDHWRVYHKGLNDGTNPQNYHLKLDTDAAEDPNSGIFNNTAPSSTSITLGNNDAVNKNGSFYLAALFGTVAGVSMVDSYDGSNSEKTITTGFSPRFVIIKAANSSGQWNVLDTSRGWGSGNDTYLKLNSSAGPISSYNIGAPTPTGFTLTGNMGGFNVSGVRYIFYAHA